MIWGPAGSACLTWNYQEESKSGENALDSSTISAHVNWASGMYVTDFKSQLPIFYICDLAQINPTTHLSQGKSNTREPSGKEWILYVAPASHRAGRDQWFPSSGAVSFLRWWMFQKVRTMI